MNPHQQIMIDSNELPPPPSYFSLMREKLKNTKENYKLGAAGRALIPTLLKSANQAINKTNSSNLLVASLAALGLSSITNSISASASASASALLLSGPQSIAVWAGLTSAFYISSILFKSSKPKNKTTLKEWVEKLEYVPQDQLRTYIEKSTDKNGLTFVEYILLEEKENCNNILDDLEKPLAKILEGDSKKLQNFLIKFIQSKPSHASSHFISYRINNKNLSHALTQIKKDLEVNPTIKKKLDEEFYYRFHLPNTTITI